MSNKTTEALAVKALEMIAGERMCINNLLSDKDIAREALAAIREPLADHVEQSLTMVAEPVNHSEHYWLHEINNARADGYERGYMAAKKLYAEPVKQEPVGDMASAWFKKCCQLQDELNALKKAQPMKQELVAWVDVSEQMPKPSKPVLIRYVINSPAYGGTRSRVIRAQWIPAKTEESNDEDHFEYDEDTDTYYIPEGWYELVDNWDEYSSVHVCEGDITHWMPLPEFPDAAPVERQWVDLTEGEQEAIYIKCNTPSEYTNAVIAAFKEKNNV